MAVQLAKRWGLRVIGSASSPEKARVVREEFGADAAFDYHDAPYKQLRAFAPDGIDVYFDNVGGEQLEAAIAATRDHARLVLCGAVSQYNAATPPPGPRNLAIAIGRRLRLEGFIVIDHFGRRGEFVAEVAPLVASGEIRSKIDDRRRPRERARRLHEHPSAERERREGGRPHRLTCRAVCRG